MKVIDFLEQQSELMQFQGWANVADVDPCKVSTKELRYWLRENDKPIFSVHPKAANQFVNMGKLASMILRKGGKRKVRVPLHVPWPQWWYSKLLENLEFVSAKLLFSFCSSLLNDILEYSDYLLNYTHNLPGLTLCVE